MPFQLAGTSALNANPASPSSLLAPLSWRGIAGSMGGQVAASVLGMAAEVMFGIAAGRMGGRVAVPVVGIAAEIALGIAAGRMGGEVAVPIEPFLELRLGISPRLQDMFVNEHGDVVVSVSMEGARLVSAHGASLAYAMRVNTRRSFCRWAVPILYAGEARTATLGYTNIMFGKRCVWGLAAGACARLGVP
jgi:hypothetical protein